MKIRYFEDEDHLATHAADIVITEIRKKPSLLLCPATGNTPKTAYQKMVDKLQVEEAAQLRIIKLDEWGSVPFSNEGTCEQYLHNHLLKPLHISEERYFSFMSQAQDPASEVARIQEILKRESPIDICILGLGANGHIAFNEPADTLHPHAHIASLSPESLNHTMTTSMDEKPTYGLTLGMADILQSKMIVMLITGSHKKEITKRLLSKEITTELPASLLWMHPNVHCLMDDAVRE